MLTTFYLDPECLEKGNFQDDATAASAAQLFVDLWQHLGILVSPGQPYEDAFELAVDGAYPQAAILLRRGKASGIKLSVVSQQPPAIPVRHQTDITRARTHMAIVSPFGAMGVGFGNGQAAINIGQTEAVRFDCLASSPRLRAASALASTDIGVGESRADIWDNRFSLLSKICNPLVINDPWAIKRLLEWDAIVKGRRSTGGYEDRMADGNGLCFLLRQMRSKLTNTSIIVYSATDGAADLDRAADIVEKMVPAARLRKSVIEIRSVGRLRYPDHDRFIRFGDHHIVTLGSGLEVLDFKTTQKPHQSTFRKQNKVFREIEADLIRTCIETRTL